MMRYFTVTSEDFTIEMVNETLANMLNHREEPFRPTLRECGIDSIKFIKEGNWTFFEANFNE